MCGGNGDTTLPLLGCLVNGAIIEEVGESLLGLPLGNGGGECCLETQKVNCYILENEAMFCSYLSVINVANGT